MRIKTTVFAGLLGLAFALGVTSSDARAAGGKSKGKLSSDDKKFIEKTAQSGLGEVHLSLLAKQKATTPQVKQFADRMYNDHTQANQQLIELAQRKGVTPPNQMDKESSQSYQELRDLSGVEFDKRYMSLMLKDHKEDLSEFQKQARKGKDTDLKSWAAEMVPTLQHHMMMAQSINSRLSGKTGSSGGKGGTGGTGGQGGTGGTGGSNSGGSSGDTGGAGMP